MVARKYTHTTPSPSFEYGDEGPRAACADRPDIFDILFDTSAGASYRWAVREARDLCITCPIQAACFTENKGEGWVRAIVTQGTRQPPTKLPSCGKSSGSEAHRKRNQWTCEECTTALREHKRKLRAA